MQGATSLCEEFPPLSGLWVSPPAKQEGWAEILEGPPHLQITSKFQDLSLEVSAPCLSLSQAAGGSETAALFPSVSQIHQGAEWEFGREPADL